MQIGKLEKRIEEIKGKLARIGEMRPGSINEQLTVCGNSSCRCADPKRPRKHGPYYQLSYVHQGKSTTQFIQKELVGAVRAQLANYKNFKALTTEWVDIALTLAKENLRADKERHKSEARALRQKRPAVSGTRSRTTPR
jgi:hypothetical protein